MNKSNSPESVVGQRFAKAKREWHDLSHTHLASYAVGFHTPMKVLPLTGNSTVVLNMEHALQTNPTATPVFDSMRVNVRVFFYPQRLCTRGLYGNNYMGINRIEDIELPILIYGSAYPILDVGNIEVVPYGSLLNRLGYPASILAEQPIPLDNRRWLSPDLEIYNGGSGIDLTWNMSPVIGYYDIFNHFLANPYDKEVPMTTWSATWLGKEIDGQPLHWTGMEYHNLDDAIDWMMKLKGFVDTNNSATIPSVASLFIPDDYTTNDSIVGGLAGPYGRLTVKVNNPSNESMQFGTKPIASIQKLFDNRISQLGLCPSTYMEDGVTTYFDNEEIEDLMTTEIGDDVESIRFGKSIWNRLFRSILDGKKYKDWEYIHFGNKLKMSDHPIFCGADFFNLRFNDVFNASASDESIPLGASASRGDKGRTDRKEIVFTAQEPGYMFVLCDIVPYVSYAGRLPNWLDYKTMASFPLPEFSGYTFQDLKGSDVVLTSAPYASGEGSDLNAVNNFVIGKQPLYYDYMTAVDTLGGIFETSLLDTYTFKRTFNFESLVEADVPLDRVTSGQFAVSSTYIQKLMYDYAFPDWGQNGGENIFIKTQFDLRVLQPIARQVAKTRI